MTQNSGGREKFPISQEVQVLLLTGIIEPKIYVVEPEPVDDEDPNTNKPDFVRADRKGHVPLRERDGTRTCKVHFRRILPLNSDGKATVIESSDKYRAVCPKCGNVFDVEPNCERITCPNDGEFNLHWLGVKPMTTTKEATTATGKGDKDTKKADKPKADKAKKVAKEPILVNFDDLKALDGCELWTKKNVKFDHPEVDVRAHCLLLTNATPRKYCFNTYNGALGKKSQALYTAEFLSDTAVTGGKRERPWFAVKDLDKERTNLTKNGYEQS
jgi:hypothetical protein